MTQTTDLTTQLKAVKRKSVHEMIVSQIQDLVDGEKLKPGDKLPTERELAAAFKVSRHTVREAIRALENQNILKSRPGSGTFVIFNEEQELNDVLVRYVSRERDKLSEVFQLRLILEPQIAFLAAQNATDSDIATLEKILSEQEDLAKDGDPARWFELDTELHLAIAKASGNNLLAKVVQLVMGLLSVCRAEAYQTRKRIQTSTEKHRVIVQAISKRDPEQAQKAITDHVVQLEEVITEEFER